MAQVDLKQLISKFNETCRKTLEGATGLCMSRSHFNIEIEHWLFKILEIPGTDLEILIRQYDIDPSRLVGDITKSLDGFKTGNARAPGLSPDLVKLAKEGWLIGSVDFNESRLRSGHLVAAMLSDESLSRIANGTSEEFKKISIDNLKAGFHAILKDSVETGQGGAIATSGPVPSGQSTVGQAGGETPSLDQFTIDLTEKAKSGQIDPVLGRDPEIRQITDILTRRRQNNPILTGEAGVGKTAVVEGFALRIAKGDVPPALKNVSVRSLDLALLQAGAGVKGEFENRLKSVINEVKSSPTPIIMFIDEAHTMIGAGGQAGQGDAANLLKPALARGELRTIAATTWSEYKKYFEKDPALARRFQVIKVEEPSEKSAIEMMRGITSTLEQHHGVRVMNEAIVDSVRLSSRYISGRQLPDKSVSLLDTTCARIGLSQASTPAPVEDCQRRIDSLKVAIDVMNRESEVGVDHSEDLEISRQQLADTEKEYADLNQRWQNELELVNQINTINEKLTGINGKSDPDHSESDADSDVDSQQTANETSPTDEDTSTNEDTSTDEDTSTNESPDKAALVAQLTELKNELLDIQGTNPLVHAEVNSQSVAETVSSWTGIPLGRMVSDEIKTVLNLKDLMEESIIGQSHALDQIAQSIRTSRANLNDPGQPIGVFLLAGTSGVGKTETAITLAELLYGGEQNMTVINMSEFKEEHKVSMLMGTSAGYVGYGEGGVLTEAVRRKPYSVVLLDEMEKAHPGVQDIFYQVFDKGAMKDGEGRDIDFRNTVIMMTSNAGTDLIKNLCADPEMAPAPEVFVEAVFPELLKTFKPAFLGRVKIIPYYPLNDEVIKKIIGLKLGKVARRIRENYKASFDYSEELVQSIADRCTEVDTGARNIDHILNKTLLPELSGEFLARLADNQPISAVHLSVGEDGKFIYKIS